MKTPSGRAVRPTPARVKEALFSILGSRIDGARVLDLFAGTGALGFESLSRGASAAVFVEQHRPTAAALSAAAIDLGVRDRVTVMSVPAERAAKLVDGRFDVVFADPPYVQAYPAATFAALRDRGAIDAESLLVYEYTSQRPQPDDVNFNVERTEVYGEVALAFLRVREAA